MRAPRPLRGRLPFPAGAAAAALALAPLLTASLPGCRRSGEAAAARPGPVPYRPPRLVLTGEIAAARAAALAVPRTPAWTVPLRFLEADGARVTRGQRVAEFDGTSFAAELADGRLRVAQALSALERQAAEAEAARADALAAVERRRTAAEIARLEAAVPDELRSRREHEEKRLALARAETDLAKAEEDLAASGAAAEAEREVLRIALEKVRRDVRAAEEAVAALTLAAPQDGVLVVGDNPRERRKVQVGDLLWPGVVVARVPDLSRLQVEASLFDVDDGALAPGTTALAFPDAFPQRRLSGRVSDVAAVAQPLSTESLRRAFRVVVPIEEGDVEGLRPGMSVKLEVPRKGSGDADSAGGVSGPGAALLAAAPRARAVREDLVVGVELKGTLQALDSDQLGPVPAPNVWDYRISMMAPEGATVKKGRPVLAFDTVKLAQEREEKRAEGESAAREIDKRERDLALRRREVDLALAEAASRRRKAELSSAVPEELTGRNELVRARLQGALAGRELELLTAKREASERAAAIELASLREKERRARERVAELSATIASMTLAAPRDGVVVYLSNWRDEKKKVGDSCWRGEKVMEVPDLARLGVKGEVDEADAGRIAEGQRVAFRLDAHPDLELTGRVQQIRRVVQRASPRLPQKVARLEVALDRVDASRMRPGMRLRGRVEVERAPRVVTVPLDSLFATARGPVVYRPGREAPVPVTVGRRGEEKVEVLSGLSEGDEVLRIGPGAPSPGKGAT